MKKNCILYIALYGLCEGMSQTFLKTFYDRIAAELKKGHILRDLLYGSRKVLEMQELQKKGLCFLISPRKGEILLVDLPPLVNIRVQVYLRGLDRGMTEIFLYNPEIL